MTPDTPHNPSNDESIDAQLDALLAEEAIDAQIAPEELEAKVLALTDPEMLALLDEAMAPEPAPERLADNILAATLPGAAQRRDAHGTGVLARIGPMTWRYAAAAAIVLATGTGLWWVGQQSDSGDPIVAGGQDNTEEVVFPEYVTDDRYFDQSAEPSGLALDNITEPFDNYTLDRDDIWSDMDGYEQFLADFEADVPAT